MSARGFLGAGDLYIARYNPATAQFDAFKGPYEATKFEIKPNVELKEMSSRGRETYGQVLESVALPRPADFTLDLAEINKESLTLALLGEQSTFNQGSGSFVDAPIVVQKGSWSELPYQNLAEAGLTVKSADGLTTYALDTDYEVNYRLGWVRVKEGSAIVNGATLEVSGSYNAVTGTQIRGAVANQIRAKFRLDGVNFADQQPVIVDVYDAVISADSAFDFLADDFATLSLPGRLKTPAGKTEPFKVNLHNV